MTVREFNNGRTVQYLSSGELTGQQIFKGPGISPDLGAFNNAMLNSGLSPLIPIGGSRTQHPSSASLLLDNVNIFKTGNITTAVCLYSSNNRFTLDIQPDPLDEFFRSWQIVEQRVTVEVPTIRRVTETIPGDAALGVDDKQVRGWVEGEGLRFTTYRSLAVFNTNKDGLAGNRIIDIADINNVNTQAGRLHELIPGSGEYWQYRPRYMKQRSSTRWVIEHSWERHQDVPQVGDGEDLYPGLATSGDGWRTAATNARVAYPRIDVGGGVTSSLPAYNRVVFWDDPQQAETNSPEVPFISPNLVHLIDAAGHLGLPGVSG